MDIVIRFMFIVGRRRMAARLETELIVSMVPFSLESLTLQANCRRRVVVVVMLSPLLCNALC